jgi:hypothetical protein
MRAILAVVLASSFAISGCSIRQTVRPVELTDNKEVCIIENPAVKNGFIESYQRVLQGKGYVVRKLPVTSSIIDCPITSTYSASWRWDLALYMVFAEIKVYREGRSVGDAIYDAHRGSANMAKFINADSKITELVSQLFPGGAGGNIGLTDATKSVSGN